MCVCVCMHWRSQGVFKGKAFTGTEFKIVGEGTNKDAGNKIKTAKSFNVLIFLHF